MSITNKLSLILETKNLIQNKLSKLYGYSIDSSFNDYPQLIDKLQIKEIKQYFTVNTGTYICDAAGYIVSKISNEGNTAYVIPFADFSALNNKITIQTYEADVDKLYLLNEGTVYTVVKSSLNIVTDAEFDLPQGVTVDVETIQGGLYKVNFNVSAHEDLVWEQNVTVTLDNKNYTVTIHQINKPEATQVESISASWIYSPFLYSYGDSGYSVIKTGNTIDYNDHVEIVTQVHLNKCLISGTGEKLPLIAKPDFLNGDPAYANSQIEPETYNIFLDANSMFIFAYPSSEFTVQEILKDPADISEDPLWLCGELSSWNRTDTYKFKHVAPDKWELIVDLPKNYGDGQNMCGFQFKIMGASGSNTEYGDWAITNTIVYGTFNRNYGCSNALANVTPGKYIITLYRDGGFTFEPIKGKKTRYAMHHSTSTEEWNTRWFTKYYNNIYYYENLNIETFAEFGIRKDEWNQDTSTNTQTGWYIATSADRPVIFGASAPVTDSGMYGITERFYKYLIVSGKQKFQYYNNGGTSEITITPPLEFDFDKHPIYWKYSAGNVSMGVVGAGSAEFSLSHTNIPDNGAFTNNSELVLFGCTDKDKANNHPLEMKLYLYRHVKENAEYIYIPVIIDDVPCLLDMFSGNILNFSDSQEYGEGELGYDELTDSSYVFIR